MGESLSLAFWGSKEQENMSKENHTTACSLTNTHLVDVARLEEAHGNAVHDAGLGVALVLADLLADGVGRGAHAAVAPAPRVAAVDVDAGRRVDDVAATQGYSREKKG